MPRPPIFRQRPRLLRTLTLLLIALTLPLSSGAIANDAAENPGGSTSAARTEDGWILVATPAPARTQVFSSLNGITHVTIDVVGDAPFLLSPYYGQETEACLVVCAELADFDIAFFAETGSGGTKLLDRAANTGEESGRTPATATLGIVYLRTPGVVPDALGYRFQYLEGDPGASSLPT